MCLCSRKKLLKQRILFLRPSGLNELQDIRFELPFHLTGQSNNGFFNSQPWGVLKSSYTAGGQNRDFGASTQAIFQLLCRERHRGKQLQKCARSSQDNNTFYYVKLEKLLDDNNDKRRSSIRKKKKKKGIKKMKDKLMVVNANLYSDLIYLKLK